MPWLLQGFQQGIGGGFWHRLGPFDHHHPPLRLHGLTAQKTTHLPDLLQPQLRRRAAADPGLFGFSTGEQTALMLKRGLYPEQIRMIARLQAPPFALGRLATGEHTFQKALSRQTTTHAIRTSEQICRSKTFTAQRRR